jgi:hypothetical protein
MEPARENRFHLLLALQRVMPQVSTTFSLDNQGKARRNPRR